MHARHMNSDHMTSFLVSYEYMQASKKVYNLLGKTHILKCTKI